VIVGKAAPGGPEQSIIPTDDRDMVVYYIVLHKYKYQYGSVELELLLGS